MKEDFLQYIWQYQLFNTTDLKTTIGESVYIEKTGSYDHQSGPDFKQARIIINDQRWAGQVEIHLKASDWYVHHHEKDDNYNNVILHVVWEDDMPVFRSNGEIISTLELKGLVSNHLLKTYNELTHFTEKWPTCEPYLSGIDSFTIDKWLERLYINRLEQKSQSLDAILKRTKNDWEYTLFILIAKYFGLQYNGTAFQQMAEKLDFKIIKQERHHPLHLEALFFGMTGLFTDQESDYAQELKKIFTYLSHKYSLKPIEQRVTFYRLRPANFPTIRLSQLAQLYSSQVALFSQIINDDYHSLQKHLRTQTGDFWQTHYVFDKQHHKRSKYLSKSFIDLLIINVVSPLKFAYQQYLGNPDFNAIIPLLEAIKPEQNHIIKKFNTLTIKAENALQSQALITLKNDYCQPKNCLHCDIGLKILKKSRS